MCRPSASACSTCVSSSRKQWPRARPRASSRSYSSISSAAVRSSALHWPSCIIQSCMVDDVSAMARIRRRRNQGASSNSRSVASGSKVAYWTAVADQTMWSAAPPNSVSIPKVSPGRRMPRICRRPSSRMRQRNAQPSRRVRMRTPPSPARSMAVLRGARRKPVRSAWISVSSGARLAWPGTRLGRADPGMGGSSHNVGRHVVTKSYQCGSMEA